MFTIKQASARTGIPVATLRAWERRYAVVSPRRTESGYRVYDERTLATLTAMRRLVDQGWSPATAAAEVADGTASPGQTDRTDRQLDTATVQQLTTAFVEAAAEVDVVAVEAVLEEAFSLGSFETVTDTWLMPTLWALGEAWAGGRVDVAGEHAASHAVMRHLSQAFGAAAYRSGGPRVVVGLPAGAHHELGALAFATAARRRGLGVVYVGADLPVDSWLRAVRAFPTRAAVITVPTAEDRESAVATAQGLLQGMGDLVVAAGGGHAHDLAPGVLSLPHSITAAVGALDGR